MWLVLREVTSVLYVFPFFYCLYFCGYSIFMIASSMDRAPLPSDSKTIMGPGLAVVGTPDSASDVAASARGARELSLVAKWHGDGYCTHRLDVQGASPTCVCLDTGRRGS